MESSNSPFLTYLYTGDGKGKTSSAFGVALRACGRQKQVNITQFMKGPMFISGEFSAIEKYLNEYITISKFSGNHWVNLKQPLQEDIDLANKTLDYACNQLSKMPFLFILDEVNTACGFNLIDPLKVVEFCDKANKTSHVILTGQRAPQVLIDRADLVTEMKKIKHPYDKGTLAVEGLEW